MQHLSFAGDKYILRFTGKLPQAAIRIFDDGGHQLKDALTDAAMEYNKRKE